MIDFVIRERAWRMRWGGRNIMGEFIWLTPNGVSQVVMRSRVGMFGWCVFGVKSAGNGRGMAWVQG